MTAFLERLRWRIVTRLDRIPSFCWADLVMWANGNNDLLPRRSIQSCQADAARNGNCWCGKVRDDEAEQRWYAEHHDGGWTLTGEPAQWPGAEQ